MGKLTPRRPWLVLPRLMLRPRLGRVVSRDLSHTGRNPGIQIKLELRKLTDSEIVDTGKVITTHSNFPYPIPRGTELFDGYRHSGLH